MKTIFFLLSAFWINAMAGQMLQQPAATIIGVPESVTIRFSNDYPNTAVKWALDGKYYVARYTDKKSGGGRMAVYDKKADFVREDFEMKGGYPATISDYIQKAYPNEKYTVWASNDDYGQPFYYSECLDKVIWFDMNGNYSAKRPGHYK
jgi:hypothetical protein